jgi:hypothetical protein
MGKKAIKLKIPAWLAVFLGGVKDVLDGLTGLGIAGAAAETTFQFVPIATLIFFATGRFLGYILRAYTSQEISTDDK